jgi:hypothetical protein
MVRGKVPEHAPSVWIDQTRKVSETFRVSCPRRASVSPPHFRFCKWGGARDRACQGPGFFGHRLGEVGDNV